MIACIGGGCTIVEVAVIVAAVKATTVFLKRVFKR